MKQPGKLYIVATPIGNLRDITLRALDVLREVDVIVCEELRIGSTLLKRLEVPVRELMALNEHNETKDADAVLLRLAQGQNLALISDCGTPVFSDPGAQVIELVASAGFQVIPIPGASSLTTALSILDFKPEKFVFAGFLPRDEVERSAELTRLKSLGMAVILMDTPYRLVRLMDEVVKAFGKGHRATLACDLSLPEERIFRGSLGEIQHQVGARKAEFILILHPPISRARGR